MEEAITKARKIHSDVEEMAKQSHVFRTRFRTLLEAQLEMINSDDWNELESDLSENT